MSDDYVIASVREKDFTLIQSTISKKRITFKQPRLSLLFELCVFISIMAVTAFAIDAISHNIESPKQKKEPLYINY